MGLRASTNPVRFTGKAKNNGFTLLPDGFVAMASIDWKLMDARRYRFTFVRREFLGDIRCYVVDAALQRPSDDGFAGRLWIEDRGYNIVRFQGINSDVGTSVLHERISFHVDSWRTSVMGGLWVPSLAYVEEIPPKGAAEAGPYYKGQIRMWGYDSGRTAATDEFTTIRVDDPAVNKTMPTERQPSPVESRRQWEREAETNVFERLDQTALLAAPGPVERVLETVVNNLLVTNDVVLDRPVRVRVLLTSPFESFAVGHTIVVSRGLIDVLPDEASLAMVLAGELSHIVLGHHVNDTYFAFPNRLAISDADLLGRLTALLDPADEAKADQKALELLQHSPYQDKLAGPSLFLRFITANKARFASLIQPRSDASTGTGRLLRLSSLLKDMPALALDQPDQIAALTLGARLELDPWSRRLQLLPSVAVPLLSANEETPLVLNPIGLYLKYHVQLPGEPPVVAAIAARNQGIAP